MVNLFRRFQQPLLIVLTVIVILSFVVFYNLPGARNGGGLHALPVGTLYGEGVSLLDVQRSQKHFEVARFLGLNNLLRGMVGDVRTIDEAQENYTWNSMVLRHEAEALGIMSSEPGDAEWRVLGKEVEDRITKLPIFSKGGGFDMQQYLDFKQHVASRGMTDRDVEEVIADQIRLEKLKEVVGSTIAVSPEEVLQAYTDQNQKLEVSVVRLKLDDFKAAVNVTDEDVKKLYEERKDSLKSPEKRKVKFAAFPLPKSDKPLTGPARADAMQRAVEQARAMAETMTGKDVSFDETAKAQGAATVSETPLFEASSAPAELFSSSPAAAAAFRLSKEQPNSDVISTAQGALVLQFAGVEESHPLSLEEAKAQLTEQLKQERSQEAMNLKAGELRTKIEAELKGGKSFADAAAAAGVQAEKIPPFSPAERLKQEIPEGMSIMGSSMDLADGQLSEFTPTPAGGLLIHLDQRLPVDNGAYEKEKESLTRNLGEGKGEAVFEDWLRTRRKAANLQIAHS